MNPAALICQAAAEGVSLALSPTGTIKATGNAEAVNRWLPVLRKNKPGIVVALATDPAVFDFALPADPDSDREAIEERAAIVAEGCGMESVQALLEARWHVEREQSWRVFLHNARRILEAPVAARAGLLERYHAEAIGQYGRVTAQTMAGTMRRWLTAPAGGE